MTDQSAFPPRVLDRSSRGRARVRAEIRRRRAGDLRRDRCADRRRADGRAHERGSAAAHRSKPARPGTSAARARALWRKGESSGHIQRVVEMRVDCDQDAVWIKVEQEGPGACHTGRRSCFYRAVPLGKARRGDARIPRRRKGVRSEGGLRQDDNRYLAIARARCQHLLCARQGAAGRTSRRRSPTRPTPGAAAKAATIGAGLGERLGGRREHLVDDRDLRGMDRQLAGEAVAARFLGFAPQPSRDCGSRHRSCRSPRSAQRPRRARQSVRASR